MHGAKVVHGARERAESSKTSGGQFQSVAERIHPIKSREERRKTMQAERERERERERGRERERRHRERDWSCVLDEGKKVNSVLFSFKKYIMT